MIARTAVVMAVLSVIFAGVIAAGQIKDKPARFRVMNEVVTPSVGPLTATIGPIGNSLLNCSFEPAVYRTRFFAEAGAPDRIIAGPKVLSHYNTLRQGFYDGASVRVYRITDEKVKIVRRDSVVESLMSGWIRLQSDREVLSPDETTFQYRLADWNRTEVPYYFTVMAVNANGKASKPANAVRIVKPPSSAKAKAKASKKIRLRRRRKGEALPVPPPPTRLKGDLDPKTGVVTLSWNPVRAKGLAGYRIGISDYAPQKHKGFALVLKGEAKDPAQHIKKGDWVVVSKLFETFSRRQNLSNRVYGARKANRLAMPQGLELYPDEDPALTWELERYPTGQPRPVKDGGQAALKLTLKDDRKIEFKKYNHAGTGQTWYPILQPGKDYVVEAWVKQKGMTDPTFTFSMTGFYSKKIQPISFKAGTEWKLHTVTFAPKVLWEGKGGVGQMVLSFRGPGTVWLDNIRVYAKEAQFLDYLPYEYASLAKSGMVGLRTHGFIKTGTSTYGMEQFTNPGGVTNGIRKENTLPQTLAVMRKAKVLPWLQVEMHMTPEEWLGFVEYLAAPYNPEKDKPETKPWAYKRHAQGQTKPWSDEFETIYFEISNETWNRLFNPWVFEGMTDAATGRKYDRGEVYGFFQEHIIDCLKRSPYWESAGLDNKFRFVLGGWGSREYGKLAASRSPRSHYLTTAAYNGGWDEGEGPAKEDDASLWRVLVQVPQKGTVRSQRLRADREELRGRVNPKLELGTYEAGPGYALSGLNKQPKMTNEQVMAQERTMKSLGGGTATLDAFLDKAYHGFILQNFFTFYHGRTHWISHTSWAKGARAHPPWLVMQLFNRHGTGDFLKVERLASPTVDVRAYKRRKAMKDVPLIACYASRRGDRLNLFLISRKLDHYPAKGDPGFTPVTVDLPFAKASKITLHRMSGDPRAHNLDANNVEIKTVEIPASACSQTFVLNEKTGADARGLPPAATFLYVFEEVKGGKLSDRVPRNRPESSAGCNHTPHAGCSGRPVPAH